MPWIYEMIGVDLFKIHHSRHIDLKTMAAGPQHIPDFGSGS
jgi:hypothetical protein